MLAEDNAGYKEEVNSCLKRLENLQHENIQLKNKIADIIQHDVDGDVLDRIEGFLTSLLNKDAVIALLRYDIAEEMKRNGLASCQQIKANYKQDINKMETEFKRLKTDFTNYISHAFPA
jgi:FtsZ-binding cell division protein ZapB